MGTHYAFAAVMIAVPWALAWRWGRRGAWVKLSLMTLLVLFSPLWFYLYCGATACGQGAILVVPMTPVAIVSGLGALASAALAVYLGGP
jgi:hypothetical protein